VAITRVLPGRPVVRQTEVFHQADPYVIEVHSKTLRFRVKGRRDLEALELPIQAAIDLAQARARRIPPTRSPRSRG
jgi:hypothetical protein